MHSIDEIMQIISEATIPPAEAQSLNQYLLGRLDIEDDMEENLESGRNLEIVSSGEIVYIFESSIYVNVGHLVPGTLLCAILKWLV